MGQLLPAWVLIAEDAASAFLRAAGNTLLQAAGLSVLAGLACALLAAGLIYTGARSTPPRIAAGRVWAEWKRRRLLWGVCLAAGTAGALLAADAVGREFATRDLYWITRARDLFQICRLGGATGYLFGLLALVTVSLVLRRRGLARARAR